MLEIDKFGDLVVVPIVFMAFEIYIIIGFYSFHTGDPVIKILQNN